jgi:hypothetical protein
MLEYVFKKKIGLKNMESTSNIKATIPPLLKKLESDRACNVGTLPYRFR